MPISSMTTTIYECSDGKKFESEVEAEQYEKACENAEQISITVQSYLNLHGLVGRKRSQQENMAHKIVNFILAFDGTPIERTVEEPVVEVVKAAAEVVQIKPAAEPEVLENEDDSLFL